MTELNKARRYSRVKSSKATFLAWQGPAGRCVSRVETLGLGGLFICTPEPPPLGCAIQLIFDLPEGEVRARAVVRSAKPGEGMGVEFVAMEQQDRARLARWLSRQST